MWRRRGKRSGQREQGRRARTVEVGWRPEHAAALLERLAAVTQLVAVTIDAHGNFPLMSHVWGHQRAEDAPTVIAAEFGSLYGELQAAAAWWKLPLEVMPAAEAAMGGEVRRAGEQRARSQGRSPGGWRPEDAGTLAEALALVSYAVAATVGVAGRFALLRGPFGQEIPRRPGQDMGDGATWLATTFAELQARLVVAAEWWDLPLDRMTDAEMEAMEDVRRERSRA